MSDINYTDALRYKKHIISCRPEFKRLRDKYDRPQARCPSDYPINKWSAEGCAYVAAARNIRDRLETLAQTESKVAQALSKSSDHVTSSDAQWMADFYDYCSYIAHRQWDGNGNTRWLIRCMCHLAYTLSDLALLGHVIKFEEQYQQNEVVVEFERRMYGECPHPRPI